MKSTQEWSKYWAERKIDWNKAYSETWNHPHRALIIAVLKTFGWTSLFEVGCGSAPNLLAIMKHFKDKQLGGVDVNPDAIALASKTFTGGVFKVGSLDDIMMSDNSTDVVLSDMSLIYIDPKRIDKAIEEIKRIARDYVVFCEFHSEKWISRLSLRWNSGYNAYNYKRLLEKHGFYDVTVWKIPEEAWPGGDPQRTFGYIIRAKVPKRK